jgi:tetratricopeptide (TPR) repeat protein
MASISRSERELWAALRAEDPRSRAEGGFALASLLANRGQLESAEELLFGLTAEGGDALRAEAWIRLAEVLRDQGKARYGEFAYRRAAEYADVLETPGILIDLAARHEAGGEPGPALRIYERVARQAVDGTVRATAAFRLGRLLRRLGRPSLALAPLREALAQAGPSQVPDIAVALAQVLIETAAEAPAGRAARDQAEHLLQQAIDSDHPDLSPRAAIALAELRQGQGQFTEAYRLCQLVIDSAHPDFSEQAHVMQSHLLHGELDRAGRGPGSITNFDLTPYARPRPVQPRPVPRMTSGRPEGCRAAPQPFPIAPPPIDEASCPAQEAKLLFVVTHHGSRITVELDAQLSELTSASPITSLIASFKRYLGARRPTAITERSCFSAPGPTGQRLDLPPALALPRLRGASAHLRERILGDMLAAAIENELVDLRTLRALVSELPTPDPALLHERGSLAPLTKTIFELLVERHFGEEGPRSGPVEDRHPASWHVVFPDYVERLCRGASCSRWSVASELPRLTVDVDAVSLHGEAARPAEEADPCDPQADYHGLHG